MELSPRKQLELWIGINILLFNVVFFSFFIEPVFKAFHHYSKVFHYTQLGFDTNTFLLILYICFFIILYTYYLFTIHSGFQNKGPQRESTAEKITYGLAGAPIITLSVALTYLQLLTPTKTLSFPTAIVGLILSTGIGMAYAHLIFIISPTKWAWNDPNAEDGVVYSSKIYRYFFGE